MFVPIWVIVLFIFVAMAIGALIGFQGGYNFAYKSLLTNHIVGDIVYTDEEKEEIAVGFYSQEHVHKMKTMKFVVFGITKRK